MSDGIILTFSVLRSIIHYNATNRKTYFLLLRAVNNLGVYIIKFPVAFDCYN